MTAAASIWRVWGWPRWISTVMSMSANSVPNLPAAADSSTLPRIRKKLSLRGHFTAGDIQVGVDDGKLKINKEGGYKKFVKDVEQVTFSGKTAQMNNLQVFYVTERCVFTLTQEGVELIEIAPGVDLEKDILAYMDFKPIIKNPRLMDERIFKLPPMGLKEDLLSIPLADRLTYDAAANILYINFEGLAVRTKKDVEEIAAAVEAICKPLGKKVKTIVNYDNFSIVPELEDDYINMVKYVVSEFYTDVTRYTTSAFLRMKLGDELQSRNLAPHIFQSKEEAKQALEKKE